MPAAIPARIRTILSIGVLLLCGTILCAYGRQAGNVPVKAGRPAVHHITAGSLPPPYSTASANNQPHLTRRPPGAALYVPPGFRVEEWAAGLEHPRLMTVAPNGDVFVSEGPYGQVAVLRPGNGGGKPAIRSIFVRGLNEPFGIAFYPPGDRPNAVYIADTDAVIRFPYRNGDLKARGPGRTLLHLPGYGYNQHWTRTIAFSPDGKKMVVSVGSKSNVGIEPPPRGCVMEYNPDGTGGHVYASGLRNAVGLAFNPVNGVLWAAVNERDELGDNSPPDYVTSVRPGGFYGWPYYYIGAHHDPRMPQRPALRNRTIVPDVLLEAHCAALSIEFYTGSQFPQEYRNDGFVAMHGSWNRRIRDGYKVVRVPMRTDGTARGDYQDFVWGWNANGRVWGRPVYVQVARDGSLLISDDGGNKIWRVTANSTVAANGEVR